MNGIEEWQAAVGREASETQILDPLALQRYARAVGLDDAGDGVPLPHWAFFLPCPRDGEIGPDGHPKRGDFLPAITLPRRMFASAAMHFDGPLEMGCEAHLVSRVASVEQKTGHSGALVFAEVERVLEQGGVARVREKQTYVYRDWGAPVPLPDIADPLPDGELWEPDTVALFRFSAATFNGHRIHYDLPYTREVEGYPALIVHGPFTAAKLAKMAMREGELAAFSFRAMAPLFLGQPIALRRAGDDMFEAVRADGTVAMQARVAFR